MKCSQQDSEIYQYLSELLILLKTKLKKFLSKHPGQNTKGIHNKVDDQIAKYLERIANLAQLNRSFLSICKRFMLGVHQIVRQVQKYVPKYKVQLNVILKKMENMTNTNLDQHNHIMTVCKLFEVIVENKEYLKNLKLANKQQPDCQMKQTNFSYHLSQTNKNQNHSKSTQNFQSFIAKQNNSSLKASHKQFIGSFQLKTKQNRKLARASSSLQQNAIVWQISTSTITQSNLMNPHSYRLKSKIQSARTFRTIESEPSQVQTQKYKLSSNSTYRLKEKLVPVLNLLTIDDLPMQKLKKEGTRIKRKRFYIKSTQQNKYRFESHQQKTRKYLTTTMSSNVY